ncbi:DNA repair protein RadA [Candidatus Saccharibacteria bacterium]|jgi:DNA repair protein RadA/Sms|nr:DNA repair protein RadA [Candidatus Saccharibacteria bacterium]MBP7834578.1 DNA repair protein RadA [Candidatus Saccharibacteria bacterium]
MAKTKVIYSCSACGAVLGGWAGKCSVCGEWNTIVEQIDTSASNLGGKSVSGGKVLSYEPVLKNPKNIDKRLSVGVSDIDDVLGGGLVAGSVVLIAGEPGIGKSTLLMQLANNAANIGRVLYISGEESANQVSMRANRLGAVGKNLLLASSTSANDIATTISSGNFDLVIVDSIQTIATNEISSSPGTVSQITNSTSLISSSAKASNTALVLVGHVTKEGSIAGPKVLEHVVDAVLQLEGNRYGGFRVLRALKNRFGSTNEAAILEMQDSGLQVVENPSASLLAERQKSDGSVVLATLEGTRPILVEVQALVNTTSYGYPKRATSGFDLNRLNLLVAMLERRTKLKLADKDIYINIVGGIKITEPAADLAVIMAIASAAKGMELKSDAVVFGEVGLSGEIRHVAWAEKRLNEIEKLGFKAAIGPKMKQNQKMPKWYYEASDIRSALNSFLTTQDTNTAPKNVIDSHNKPFVRKPSKGK